MTETTWFSMVINSSPPVGALDDSTQSQADILGGVISDITVLEGVLQGSEGLHTFAYVRTHQPGISFKGDWDVVGQKLTVCSTI